MSLRPNHHANSISLLFKVWSMSFTEVQIETLCMILYYNYMYHSNWIHLWIHWSYVFIYEMTGLKYVPFLILWVLFHYEFMIWIPKIKDKFMLWIHEFLNLIVKYRTWICCYKFIIHISDRNSFTNLVFMNQNYNGEHMEK